MVTTEMSSNHLPALSHYQACPGVAIPYFICRCSNWLQGFHNFLAPIIDVWWFVLGWYPSMWRCGSQYVKMLRAAVEMICPMSLHSVRRISTPAVNLHLIARVESDRYIRENSIVPSHPHCNTNWVRNILQSEARLPLQSLKAVRLCPMYIKHHTCPRI